MTPVSNPSRSTVIRAYITLPHATPILAVLSATALFAFIARGGWPGSLDLAALLVAMFGGQIAVGAVNELVDVELDRASKPSKPIPAGLVSEAGARIMACTGIVLMGLGSLRFSLSAFALCALGTGLGIAYSFWFKRTAWSAIPYVLAVPLIPIWVWTALERVRPGMLAIYPVAIPALIGLQVAQSIPDIEADRLVGVRTLAVTVGEGGAQVLAWSCVLVSALIAAVIAPSIMGEPSWVWGGAVVAAGAVALNAVIWRRNPTRGRLATFPLMAAGVVALGLGWALSTVS